MSLRNQAALKSSADTRQSDDLMEECVRVMTQGLGGTQTMQKRAKSVYDHKNLGTIKNRKKEKQEKMQNTNDQIILRILRMRWAWSHFARLEC